MTDFVVQIGEKLHISNKRMFSGAARRTFIGEVTAVHGTVARLEGWLFIFNSNMNEHDRKSRKQTRIIDIANGWNHVSVLPSEIRLENPAYQTIDGAMSITDGLRLRMEVTEAGPVW